MSKEKEENSDKHENVAGGSSSTGSSSCGGVRGGGLSEQQCTSEKSSSPAPASATATPSPTPSSSSRNESMSNGVGVKGEEYPLHKFTFEGEYKQLAKLLQRPPATWNLEEEITRKDKHGNTPLHLAVMLGRKECIHLLLAHHAPVKVKNNDGWTPLAEAISYGDRQTISAVLRKLKQQSHKQMEARREKLVRALEQMQDFYLEFKWEFLSWVPLLSLILPSDTCRIHKSGAKVRFDSTVIEINELRWHRGDISCIFRGDLPESESLVLMDNATKCYQRVRYEDADIEDEVDVLMSTDILAAQMSTKTIHFERAQSGWIFRGDRKEIVGGQYHSEMYSIEGLVLKQRKRREHLSHEDLRRNRAIVESIMRARRSSNSTTTNGSTTDSNADLSPSEYIDLSRRNSLQPPPAPHITWADYCTADKCPQLGRAPVLKQSNKTLRASVAMSTEFPLSVEMLVNVLEVIAPFKHISKLREFITLKLPSGFPVKFEIPLLHSFSANVTFPKFEFRDNIPSTLFEVPSHYAEDARRFPDL